MSQLTAVVRCTANLRGEPFMAIRLSYAPRLRPASTASVVVVGRPVTLLVSTINTRLPQASTGISRSVSRK
jgi:hypothetical protein